MRTIIFFIICFSTTTLVFSNNFLELNSLFGGEVVYESETVRISWDEESSNSYLDILLWNAQNSTWSMIDTNISQSNLYYNWVVPAYTIGDLFRIKIVSRNTGFYDMSLGYFSILPEQQTSDITLLNDARKDLKIYPNPFTSLLNVSILNENLLEVNIFDIFGNKVFVFYGEDDYVIIDTKNLLHGVYIIKVKTSNGSYYYGKVYKNNY